MKDLQKKCRQYSVDYLRIGFIASPNNSSMPMCLLCQKTFSNEAMKPSRLEDHFFRKHADKKNKDLAYFQHLRDLQRKQSTVPTIFSSLQKHDDDGLKAWYNISLMIAKAGKPHTIGEDLILPAVGEVLRSVLHLSSQDVLKRIPLSNNTVQRRIDEMSTNVEDTLCSILKTNVFALQLDESTLPGGEALLLSYVRYAHQGKLHQELFFARYLKTTTKGEAIYHTLEQFFNEKEIPFDNVVSIATDGAPAMIGRHRGVLSYLRKAVPNMLTVHCVIHRQHLVARNLSERLNCSLQFVISAVNRIKSNALNSRLFAKLCQDNDETFSRLLLHTEVRWLSRGNCLTRFFDLFDSLLEFLNDKDQALKKNLQKSRIDIAYLTDLFSKFNEMNLSLQGYDLNLITTKSTISSFLGKLKCYEQNLGRREFRQFPALLKIHQTTQINDSCIQTFCGHLNLLRQDFKQRFTDILELEILNWIIDPSETFGGNEISLQEELIELSSNEELKPKYKMGYHSFWMQEKNQSLYPELWKKAQKFLIAFPSSYLVERGFSVVMDLITKKRNRLDIVERGDQRLLLTTIEPDVIKLTKDHQIHPSH